MCIRDRDGVVDVVVTGSVDITTAGTYTLTYTATDSVGNTAEITRIVTVIKKIALSVESLAGNWRLTREAGV